MAEKTGMTAVVEYLGVRPADWRKLSEQDKKDLKKGVGSYNADTQTASGPLTY